MYRALRVAVVIPAFNERRAIVETVATVPDFIDDVLVIDDASTDDTSTQAELAALGRTRPSGVEVIRHPANRGVGASITTGYRRALAIGADVAVVMAYGRILPLDVLTAARRGAMNLHASLLPKYRGAAPINWAIVHGEQETGVALMQMDEGLDTGPVYARHAIALSPEENAGTLAERIASLAAEVLKRDLEPAVNGTLVAEPQAAELASHAPLIEREHLQIRWNDSALGIARLVRGMAPRPGAFTTLGGKTLRVLSARPAVGPMPPFATPGTVSVLGKRALIQTGDGRLELLVAQLEGKKPLSATDLINGRALEEGRILGASA